jgi:hypothetical protein
MTQGVLREKPEVRDLLVTARRLRDYEIFAGRGKGDALINALEPFEQPDGQVKAAHLSKLRRAMRDTCVGLDPYTLTKVIGGQSPLRQLAPKTDSTQDARNLFARFRDYAKDFSLRYIVVVFGLILMGLALHYTLWTVQANIFLSKADEHLEYDYSGNVLSLFELEAHMVSTAPKQAAPDVGYEPLQHYLNELTEIRSFNFNQSLLHQELRHLERTSDPLKALVDAIRGVPARLAPNLSPQEAQRRALVAMEDAERLMQKSDGGDVTAAISHQEPPVGPEPGEGMLASTSMTDATMTVAGGGHVDTGSEPKEAVVDMIDAIKTDSLAQTILGGPARIHSAAYDDLYASSATLLAMPFGQADRPELTREQLRNDMARLATGISTINKWYLPVLYGALGAVLFCLVRILTPNLADLGPARSILRIVFGAFAAMTISMLLVPSNLFSLDAQSSPTLIFLFCFIFGYSFDAFLVALRRLEAFVIAKMQPDDKEAPAKN